MTRSDKAPERIETARLVLRRPVPADAEPIFRRYSGDAEVTRYLSFPRHVSLDQTRAFLVYSDAEWGRWPAGPYFIESRADGTLLGSTGLAFENLQRATTGYVLARDAWGQGYATEALWAVVEATGRLGVRRLQALCHPDHRPSWRVAGRAERPRVRRPDVPLTLRNAGPAGLESMSKPPRRSSSCT